MMNINYLITQPALYMNNSIKRAFSYLYPSSSEARTISGETEDLQGDAELTNSTCSSYKQKDQIFNEIKDLLKDF